MQLVFVPLVAEYKVVVVVSDEGCNPIENQNGVCILVVFQVLEFTSKGRFHFELLICVKDRGVSDAVKNIQL